MITERQRELLQDIADGKTFSLEYHADLGEMFSAGLIADNGVTGFGRKAMQEFDAAREPEPAPLVGQTIEYTVIEDCGRFPEPEHPNPAHPLALTDAQFKVLETISMGKADGRRPTELAEFLSREFVGYEPSGPLHVTGKGYEAMYRYRRIAEMKKKPGADPEHSICGLTLAQAEFLRKIRDENHTHNSLNADRLMYDWARYRSYAYALVNYDRVLLTDTGAKALATFESFGGFLSADEREMLVNARSGKATEWTPTIGQAHLKLIDAGLIDGYGLRDKGIEIADNLLSLNLRPTKPEPAVGTDVRSPRKDRFIAVVVAALAELNPDDDPDEMLDHVAKRVNDARWSLQ
jgi:hypothetical protein